jgi:hypothetical protein
MLHVSIFLINGKGKGKHVSVHSMEEHTGIEV